MKKIVKYSLKFLKYTFLLLLVLMIFGMLFMNREGQRIYGGLTERVDYQKFRPETVNFAITNVNILSVDGDSIIPNQSIYLEDGHIAAINSTMSLPSGTKTIDGSGKYLIPGLIDMHVHLFQSPNDLLLYIANGVTEVRELIGEEDHLEWKKEIENGRIGPKLFVSSPRIGSFEPMEGLMMSYTQGYLNIQNAEEARDKIKELHEEGYDGIKIYSQVNEESYLAITETAKSLGMPIAGHVPWALGLQDVYKNGQTDIVHFEELMNALSREFNGSNRKIGSFKGDEENFLNFVEERCETLANELVGNNISVTSTLWLTESFAKQPFEIENVLKSVELEYENPGISEWSRYIPQGLGWLPEVNRYKLPANQTPEEKNASKRYWNTYVQACQIIAKKMADKGVKIMVGTDANLPPTVPGFSLHDELQSLSRAGMSNAQVLRSATAVPAEFLQSNSGKIVIGYEANLVLLDKNPLENIANTKTINTVINRGKIYDRNLLNKILSAVKDANDKSRSASIDAYDD